MIWSAGDERRGWGTRHLLNAMVGNIGTVLDGIVIRCA
jgi:hypothetical protein